VTFHSVGPLEVFFGVGFLSFINFSAVLGWRGAYQPQNLASFWRQAHETTVVWLLVFFMLLVVAFLFKISGTYSRGTAMTFFGCGWAIIILWRFILSRFLVHALAVGAFAERKAVVLAEQGQLVGSTVLEELNRCGYTLSQRFEFDRGLAPFKSINEIVELSRREPIECVFLLASWDDPRRIEALAKQLRILSVPIYLLPDRNVAHLLSNRVVNIGTSWTAELKRAPLSRIEQLCKRAIDLVLAATALIVLAPMIVLVALWIKIETGGPTIFSQRRNGFNGRTFKMYKFRTMSVLEDGPAMRQATRDDPRFTNCGRLLRRTNIDELPQLFNVIAGDMSLVGPRPHPLALNSEYETIISDYAFRHHVKPGLTGWAQVNGWRGETQTVNLMARRIEFDLWYINNWSLWLDFKILLRTLVLGLQSSAY
jgi:undecaprenyl-phosphate galactose phosphotransferase/putative colanic acid biosynthesis UDP-glucose lipid carrier transferase